MGISQFIYNSCTVCGDSISDPVCKGCYLKQTEILLEDLDLTKKDHDTILRKIKNKFPIENLNNTECILCKQDNVSLCRYCFSINLTRILKSLNFTEEMIEDLGYTSVYEESSPEIESIWGIKE